MADVDDRCGNYKLLDKIGQGGMGAVYRAVHPEIGRTVAIKVLRPELSTDEEAIARFFDEARAVNAIRNEGIVDIFDLGRRGDGSTYYVMEYLAGEDLGKLLSREGPLPANEAVPMVLQVCSALAAAHRRGIVHRDLKPQNLFVVPRGADRRLKLLDFGIAKLVHELSDRPTTSTGVVLGTIPYMAPEQARGEVVDARADIYSLGCILYELLTGQVPFAARNALAILARLAVEEPTPPSWRSHRFGVPAALDAIVLKALAKDRDARFSDVEELSTALAALDLSSLPAPSPRQAVATETSASLTLPNAATIPGHRHATPATIPVRETPRPDPPMPPPIVTGPRPLIDPSTERRVIRVVIPVLLGLVGMGAALYYSPSASSIDRPTLARWMPWFAGAIAMLCILLVLVERTQQSSRARVVVNRALTILSVAIVTTSISLKGSLTSYDILYYPMLVILDRLRENRSLAIFTYCVSVLGFAGAVIGSHLGLLPYAPLYPGWISPELVHDRSLVGLVLAVMGGITLLSLLLVDMLANRVQLREIELQKVAVGLAGRVEEQIELLRRSDDLRSYLPPALAEKILRGEADRRSARRRITVARVDCQVIANAVDETDPEDFAHLVNELYARLGERATEHGGVVDRFGAGGVTVLFGALDEGTPEAQAISAIELARAALDAIRGLAVQCQAAGIPNEPIGRGAIHQGFATVGSFGSPSRLEFTAIGPATEATIALLDGAKPGEIIVTQPVEAFVRDRVALSPRGEPVAVTGSRHPLRLYTLG